MSISKVANRYADSFLANAIEKGIVTEVASDVNIIINSINSSEEFQRFLGSPVIKAELKKSILKEIFANKISSHSLKFLEFVVDKKREDILLQILEKFVELKDDYLGIVRLDVKSAFPLSDDIKEVLLKKFETIFNKKIEADFAQDDNLLGGFVVRFRDTVYDASIKHQLEKLKQNLISGSLSLN
jgi:F-type H+-transporting ATPase subunit delta